MVVVIKVPCISVWVYECLFFFHREKDFYIEEKLLRLLLLHHSGHPVSSVQFAYDGTENEMCNEHSWGSRTGVVEVVLFLLDIMVFLSA